MTVGELIELLSAYPEHMPVVVSSDTDKIYVAPQPPTHIVVVWDGSRDEFTLAEGEGERVVWLPG